MDKPANITDEPANITEKAAFPTLKTKKLTACKKFFLLDFLLFFCIFRSNKHVEFLSLFFANKYLA
jgi:hypothetical protein